MANRYGEAALIAGRQGSSGGVSPVARWESAMKKLYPTSAAARNQSSPRGAFLGLCEEGLIKGIPAGRYQASKDNKAYAVHAVALLAEGEQTWSVSSLWKKVADPSRTHNHQMDVVMALWKNDLIVRKSAP
jgi:hypothetical protein